MKTNLADIIIVLFLVFTTVSPSLADTIAIPDISNEPPNSPNGVLRPARGLTMQQVTAQFGRPLKILKPVGAPPITRWIYKDFTVHFEYNKVIHSVVIKKKIQGYSDH